MQPLYAKSFYIAQKFNPWCHVSFWIFLFEMFWLLNIKHIPKLKTEHQFYAKMFRKALKYNISDLHNFAQYLSSVFSALIGNIIRRYKLYTSFLQISSYLVHFRYAFCMILVFSALLEYAVVNSLTRLEIDRRRRKRAMNWK